MSDKFNELGSLVTRLMEEHAVPGVVVGVLNDGNVETQGFGVTNVNHPLDVTPETLFQVGSISKTYTATLMMRLVEQGLLDLDAPIRRYLPDFRVRDEAVSAQATCRHLLTHTTGWVGDYFIDTGEGDDALPVYVQRMTDLEQMAPLGKIPSYCNSGFYVAGALIERICGQPFESVIQQTLFAPLGLEHTYLRPTDVMVHRFAAGHRRGEHGAQVATPWHLPRAVYPVGGIICTAGDLLRYARFHMDDGRTASGQQLVAADSIRSMRTVQAPLTGWADGIGLSWFFENYGAVETIQHGGGTTGQISLLHITPERGFAYAIVTNGGEGGQITRQVGDWIMAEYLGLTKPSPRPTAASVEQLAELAGLYTRPFADVTLTLESGKLSAAVVYKQGFPTAETPPPPPLPPFALALTDDGQLLSLEGPTKEATAQIIRGDDGAIAYIRFGGRLHRRAA